MGTVEIKTPLQEAVFSLLLFAGVFSAFMILSTALLPIHLLFLVALFLGNWAVFETLAKWLQRDLINTLLIASAAALIPMVIISASTGIGMLLLFALLQPLFYILFRGKVARDKILIPLTLSLFYLPLVLPLMYF